MTKRFIQALSVIFTSTILLTSYVSVNAVSPELSSTKKSLTVGKSFTLTLKNVNKKFTWTTSNKNVAKLVSTKKNSVKVKGLKVGTATVFAKIGSKKLKCKITVMEKPQPIEAPVPTEQPTTKEYKVISIRALPKYTSTMATYMNEYAQEGWVVKSTTSNGEYIFITFERDKTE